MPDLPFAFAPRPAPTAFEPVQVTLLSETELDALPFGVICLDPDGKVLRYNLAESRLARLDRAQVLGKNFFRRIAPCTIAATARSIHAKLPPSACQGEPVTMPTIDVWVSIGSARCKVPIWCFITVCISKAK